MKKVALLVAFLLALTPLAFAQGTVKAQRPDTVEVIISGEVDVPGYYRSEEINCVLNRTGGNSAGWLGGIANATIANPAGEADVDNEDSDAAIVPLVVINLDAQMGKKVFAHVMLKTNRLASDLWGGNDMGIWANGHSVVGGQDIDLPVKAAYVEIQEFLFEETTFKFGLQNLCYDLRGKGAFFIDLANSEYAWTSPVTEAWLTGSWYGPINPVSLGLGAGPADATGLARFNSNPGGFIVNYTTKDEVFSMDFYGFTVMETLSGFNPWSVGHFDEQVYGIEFAYTFPGSKEEKNKSYLSGIINCMQADQGANKVWTIGIGLDYFWQNFEFYGEVYGQFGEWWNAEEWLDTDVVWGDPDDDSVDQSAWAFYLGGKYTFNESTAKPWIDLSVWYIGGDDGDLGDGSENEDFLSYENNNATMIIEDSLLGLDIDSNYWKIMLDLGASFKLHEDNDFTINLTWAWFQIVDEPDRVGLPEATDATVDAGNDAWDVNDDLGHEIDLKFSWAYSKQCTFGLNFGFLFGADFFDGDPDDIDDGDGDSFDGGYCIDGDGMFMCIFDTNVKW